MRHMMIAVVAAVMMTGVAHAGINADMQNFFNSLGVSGNFTPAGVYKGQAAGYYTAGSAFVRMPQRSYQLISITPPSLNAGCGGIDAYLGSFSMINGKQFIQMLRNIGNNGQGYAFELALAVASPQIRSVLDDLKKFIQFVNQASINSCESAQMLVNGIAGAITGNSAKTCAGIARIKGLASDEAQAKQMCASPGFRHAMFYGGPLPPGIEDKQVANKNLVWDGLKKQVPGMDIEVKELIMSLVGTYVIDTPAASGTPDVKWIKPSGLTIEMLLNGSTMAPVYKCGIADVRCTQLSKPVNIRITGFRNVVYDAINEIRMKLVDEKYGGMATLTKKTQDLLAMTKYPVLKMMASAAAISPMLASEVGNELVEPVALEFVQRYLDWAMRIANAAAAQETMLPKGLQNLMIKNVVDKEKVLRSKMKGKSFIAASRILEKARFLDQVLVSNLTPHMRQALQYARSH